MYIKKTKLSRSKKPPSSFIGVEGTNKIYSFFHLASHFLHIYAICFPCIYSFLTVFTSDWKGTNVAYFNGLINYYYICKVYMSKFMLTFPLTCKFSFTLLPQLPPFLFFFLNKKYWNLLCHHATSDMIKGECKGKREG